MGLPNINIAFSTAAASAVQRSQKGTVALILKDSGVSGAYSLSRASDMPSALSAANKAYVTNAFLGYVVPPRKVLLYVLASNAADLSAALGYYTTVVNGIDYIAGPPDSDADDAAEIASWVASMRADGFTPKAVLPNKAADTEGVVNFTTAGITVGTTAYTTAAYCSRIAGLIAGTPMNISCTFAPLPEVTGVTRLTKSEMDTAIEAGKFIIFHDGTKVKVGRGVNSLITTTQNKGSEFKKIKIVEAVDMIRRDIRATAEDSYIGKYANSYDNKCLLITAIKGYLMGLEVAGILQEGTSSVDINVSAQEAYLKGVGIDTEDMTEQELKTANTADKVFLTVTIKILDAIEDIDVAVTI